MTEKQLIVTPAPHIRDKDSVQGIMRGVLFALIPAIIAAIYFFGSPAVWLMLVCIISALVTEAIWLVGRKKDLMLYITDGSAVLTGLLLAFTLPPTAPLWAAALGSVVAITLGKQIFGGLGYNIFNPALVGRAFLTASFPALMTRWVFDGQTAATPLGILALEGETATFLDIFLGSVPGCIGETSGIAILIGGGYLVYRGLIDWRLPVGYLGTVFVMAVIFGQNPFFHLFAGGLMLGAWFMLTDPVTSPLSRKARWVFSIGAGILVFIIRYWGDAPGGVLYSILLMNMAVPLLDRYLPDRTFGEVRGR